ncbi:hypothetical protein MMC29_006929 [Sticta canariensis]|nr:hypothetical protein [Sticta canariensis]
MTTSTLFGTPPVTDDDLRLVKGLIRLLNTPPGKLDPTKGFHVDVHPAPNYKFESHGLGLVVSAAIVIVLIILITGGRLALRWKPHDLRSGPDDERSDPLRLVTPASLLKVLGAYPKRLKWAIVDIFFGITAASLPVLNAAVPSRWRSSLDHIPVHHFNQDDGGTDNQTFIKLASKESVHNHGPYQRQLTSKASDDAIIAADQKIHSAPPVMKLQVDSAEKTPSSVLARRNRHRHSGGVGKNAV